MVTSVSHAATSFREECVRGMMWMWTDASVSGLDGEGSPR